MIKDEEQEGVNHVDIGERKFPRVKTERRCAWQVSIGTEARVGGAECTRGRATGGKESIQILEG